MKKARTITACLIAIAISLSILCVPTLAAVGNSDDISDAVAYVSQAFQQDRYTIKIPKSYLVDPSGQKTVKEMVSRIYHEAFRQSTYMFVAEKNTMTNYGHEVVIRRRPLFSQQEEEAMIEATSVAAKEILSEIIKPGMDDMQKASAIFEYISENTEYDMYTYRTALSSKNWRSDRTVVTAMNAYGCLVLRKAVCGGYAQAFNLLAREAGLLSQTRVDIINGINHAWNQVLIDNHWYTLDCTLKMFFASESEYFSAVALITI